MNTAVLLAGGSGTRMRGALRDKVLEPLWNGQSAIEICVHAFENSGCVEQYVVTCRDEEQEVAIETLIRRIAPGARVVFVRGGKERQDSVLNALKAIPGEDGLVFIHDSARPLVSSADIRTLRDLALRHGAAVLAHKVTDTIKRVENDAPAAPLTDIPRACLRAMETPQVFRLGTIRAAYEKVRAAGQAVTDDAAASAAIGVHPALLESTGPNPKLTTPADLDWVRYLLSRNNPGLMTNNTPPFRIGFGYDIHRFAEGRRLVLGGVTIPHDRGLDGHSDADCLCHAIADAILGAAGLPDIGHFFPPGKAETKDMDSLRIVSSAVTRAAEKGLNIGNIDATLIAREPKVAPHIAAMKEKLSAALGIPADRIGIKATTNEGIDGLGSGEGIAAHAVAMLWQV
jgi:2-C-methyl-D-erythritol 2,4-cyclodiphosphate synthase/2-C-methyl-D-erythritol 4-phosphate cytidylyltransferase